MAEESNKTTEALANGSKAVIVYFDNEKKKRT